MRKNILKLSAVLLALSQAPASAGPVVVELFTSQGCSDCPAADRVVSTYGLEQFQKGQVLPLSFDVDYWNYLGWKDVFSTPAWSKRQRAYDQALGVGVYTPQMVVGGRTAFVGSDQSALEKAVAGQKGRAAEARLSLAPGKTIGTFRVDAKALPALQGRRLVVLAVFENGLVTDVKAGENSGQVLRSDFVVRELIPVGELAPGQSLEKPVAAPWAGGWDAKKAGAALFLQDPATMAVSDAATLYPLAR